MSDEFWQRDITYLKGVGPKKAEVLQQALGVYTYGDLLHYYPRKYVDRSTVNTVRDVRLGKHETEEVESEGVTLIGRLEQFEEQRGKKGNKWLTAALRDETGVLQLQWFRGFAFIQKQYNEGDEVAVFGKPTFFRGKPQLAHPEMEPLQSHRAQTHAMRIIPFYGSTEAMKKRGLDTKALRQIVLTLLEQGQDAIGESLMPELRERYNLIPRAEALQQIHFPDSFQQLAAAQRRLKFEELFYFELLLATRRLLYQPARQAPVFEAVGTRFKRFYHEQLPFELTGAQKRVVRELRHDMAQPQQMNRLVQGDVGSGKTIVAVLAMLLAIDNGYQAALMAPTEILAEQHFRNLHEWLAPLNINCEFVVGSQRKRRRNEALAALANGQAQVAVGTHALLEDPVQFARLGLTIIDEQHRFGVLQRGRLWRKGGERMPHNMVMTATPIPRTLAMTSYGDIDVSVIDELPPGRKPIITAARREKDRLRVLGFVQEQVDAGHQAYFVYPLVEESAKSDLLAVEEGHASLQRSFPGYQVGIVHGRMRAADKEAEMQRFKRGDTQLLVATTVIEVGVDVPNANIMVIENAERFGLSQLHQLRGRVGRGAAQAYCILMGPDQPSAKMQQRLDAMCETNDGFRIAEADLQLRGPGDFLGTKQSGLPEFKLADVVEDSALVHEARDAAFALIREDPELAAPAHAGLRHQVQQFVAEHQLQALMA